MILLGHATLADMCGGPPTYEEMEILSIASDAWRAAEATARRRAERR